MGNIIKKAAHTFLYNFADEDTEEKIRYRLSSKYRNQIDSRLHEYDTNLKLIEDKPKQNPLVIVFVCQVPALWNTVASIYECAVKDDRVEPYIVAIPEKIMGENYDITNENYGSNDSYEFCSQRYGHSDSIINGYDEVNKSFYDLRKLNPSYVCLPRPYDMHVPPEYRSTEISKYSKIIFLPYCYNFCKWDVKLTYSQDFLSSVYSVYCENPYSYEMVRKTFASLAPKSKKKVYSLGYPAFDEYEGREHHSDSRFIKTILWMPRWTTNKAVEATTFFRYKDSIIDFFVKNKNLKLIFRPHPLMLRNFVSCHLMSEQEEENLLNIFNCNDNLVYDSDGDYSKSLLQADIIISDYSSMLAHSMLMEVPIIYTGKTSHFYSYSRRLAKGMYQIHNEKELLKTLEAVLSGEDKLKAIHSETSTSVLNGGYGAGKRILDTLVEDASNRC